MFTEGSLRACSIYGETESGRLSAGGLWVSGMLASPAFPPLSSPLPGSVFPDCTFLLILRSHVTLKVFPDPLPPLAWPSTFKGLLKPLGLSLSFSFALCMQDPE